MPDTYVGIGLALIKTCQTAHCVSHCNNLVYSFSFQPSVKATSPVRKMRCVSGRMNVAADMDTLEPAATQVRPYFFTFLGGRYLSFLLCLDTKKTV